jgi:hypothetical protein
MYQIHHLSKVRVNYVLGAKWLLRVRLLADSTSAFCRLLVNKHRPLRVEDVLSLAKERDRLQQGTGATRCALLEPADRT